MLAALAQPHRLAVFRLLVVAGPDGLPAGAMAQRLGLPASSLSFHLAQLKAAGLVLVQVRGRERIYAANFPAMRGLTDYLLENCCAGAECGTAFGEKAA